MLNVLRNRISLPLKLHISAYVIRNFGIAYLLCTVFLHMIALLPLYGSAEIAVYVENYELLFAESIQDCILMWEKDISQ